MAIGEAALAAGVTTEMVAYEDRCLNSLAKKIPLDGLVDVGKEVVSIVIESFFIL